MLTQKKVSRIRRIYLPPLHSKKNLVIKNVGLLKNVEVEISGLTVIAGENDTGKSTIGKILFSLIKACEMARGGFFYRNRKNYILKEIDRFKDVLQYPVKTKKEYDKLAQSINNFKTNVEKILIDRQSEEKRRMLIKKEIEELKKAFSENGNIKTFVNKFIKDIEESFSPKFRNKFRKNTLENLFSYIFSSEFCSKFSQQEESIIRLKSMRKKTEARLKNNRVLFLQDGGTFFKDVTYIDTPVIFQLVKLLSYPEVAEKEYMPTIKDLQRKLTSLPREIDIQEKEDINKIVDKIKVIIKGDIDRDEVGNFIFSRGKYNFKIENTATGIKSFALLLLLLKNGWLKKEDLLVIDEPEVHLHPKWQVEYCKVIIEFVKKGIAVIIATHSPYVVQGFAKYIREYGLEDYVNFYLMRNDDGVASCQNVSEELQKIFQLLAEPFDEIF